MTTALISFEDNRIGRNHNVVPTEYEYDDADDLANQIFDVARRNTVSRDLAVNINADVTHGFVSAGFHNAGRFTIVEVT